MPEGRDNLIFSHIGYVSQTLPSAQTRLVRLVQDEQEIENVVVTGIFTRKKESYTGSATTITSGQLARVSNRNVFESLKNIEPSLYIMDNTLMGSDPNTLPDMQLRGITTFPSESTGVNIKGNYQNRPNQPLFILDGFETTAEKVMDMDMTRIESITILKDAAAKALYGSKAANGVIVIETKRLAGNQELVTYTGSIEVSMPDPDELQPLQRLGEARGRAHRGRLHLGESPRRRWISPNATTHSKRRCSADWTPTGSQTPGARASATNTPSRSNWATAANCGR